MLRDKRTLALLFVAPLLVLTLMYYLFNSDTVEPKLGIVNGDQVLIRQLENVNIKVQTYHQVADSEVTIIDDQLDGLLQINHENVTLTLQNNDPSTAKALQIKVKQALTSSAPSQTKNQPMLQTATINTHYMYGTADTSFFDVLSPVLVGYFVFFFVFLISGIGLLRERTTGTLERLMATPIRKGEIITGYLVGYGMFAVIQTIIVVLFSIHVLDIVLVGSIWHVILINLLLALVALSLGLLLSAFAASEFQMIQFIPLVIIPQIFFAGIFPMEGMAHWLQIIGKVMPMYYAADALKGIMYKGLSLSDVSTDLLALILFLLTFIILNLFALKKYRK